MKKAIKTIFIMSFLLLIVLVGKVDAASLDAIAIDTNKEIVNPGTELSLNINFGTSLGSFTFDINYDNNLLEYVSTNVGTANDNGSKVRIVFYDATGGTDPKDTLSVVFKAKEGLQTSNPTDLSITAEGLANADASVQYDDILVPIKKNIVVEPKYEDYRFNFEYTGNPIVDEEKNFKLTLLSSMGKFYDHARILAEATTPNNGNVKLVGTDEQQLEHDIIDSGWGDVSGYKIGGQVNQILNLRGIFDTVGQYTITFKLIDRDNSDAVLATNSFTINVEDKNVSSDDTNIGQTNPEPNEESNKTPVQENANTTETQKNEQLPAELPKTGYNYYAIFGTIILVISIVAFLIRVRKNKLYGK